MILSSKRLIVFMCLSRRYEVHLIYIWFNIKISFIAITIFFKISCITHVVVIIRLPGILVTVIVLISFSLLVIYQIGQILVLQLKNVQAINTENTTNFGIHLLSRLDLLASWLVPQVLVMHDCNYRAIFETKVNQTFFVVGVLISLQ